VQYSCIQSLSTENKLLERQSNCMDKELTKDCKSNQELELPWRLGTPPQLVETLATAVM